MGLGSPSGPTIAARTPPAPSPTITFHSLSVSAWSSVSIWHEDASLCLNSRPPFRPMQGMPKSANSTVIT
ncbi:hypothetical protein ASD35_22695 [Pelomonas sp. Root1444]|nr:hypothetical protein ASD35_22695 [Pelomonas sp. Root1444]